LLFAPSADDHGGGLPPAVAYVRSGTNNHPHVVDIQRKGRSETVAVQQNTSAGVSNALGMSSSSTPRVADERPRGPRSLVAHPSQVPNIICMADIAAENQAPPMHNPMVTSVETHALENEAAHLRLRADRSPVGRSRRGWSRSSRVLPSLSNSARSLSPRQPFLGSSRSMASTLAQVRIRKEICDDGCTRFTELTDVSLRQGPITPTLAAISAGQAGAQKALPAPKPGVLVQPLGVSVDTNALRAENQRILPTPATQSASRVAVCTIPKG
jgi:hypothetical protein